MSFQMLQSAAAVAYDNAIKVEKPPSVGNQFYIPNAEVVC